MGRNDRIVRKSKPRRSRSSFGGQSAAERLTQTFQRFSPANLLKWRHQDHHYKPTSPAAQFWRCAGAGAAAFTVGYLASGGSINPKESVDALGVFNATIAAAAVPFLMTFERARYYWNRAAIATAALGLIFGAGTVQEQRVLASTAPIHAPNR